MNPKTQPKPRKKRKPITISVPIKDFLKEEVASLLSITDVQPVVKRVLTDKNNKISEIDIRLQGQDYALNNFLVFEKILTKQDSAVIKEYRYSLFPKTNGEKQYFRFDFQPYKIPEHFPDCHINVDKQTYGKHHLVYPKDTSLDLHKLTMSKAINVFCQYEQTNIHPAVKLGETYVPLINGGMKNETIY